MIASWYWKHQPQENETMSIGIFTKRMSVFSYWMWSDDECKTHGIAKKKDIASKY